MDRRTERDVVIVAIVDMLVVLCGRVCVSTGLCFPGWTGMDANTRLPQGRHCRKAPVDRAPCPFRMDNRWVNTCLQNCSLLIVSRAFLVLDVSGDSHSSS